MLRLFGAIVLLSAAAMQPSLAAAANQDATPERPPPMPLISRDATVTASDEIHAARLAVDDDYHSVWRSSVPASITVEIPEGASPGEALVAWYGDAFNIEYDFALVGIDAYNLPRDYALAVSPDGEQWKHITAVSGNTLHSRQHLVDLTGQRFLRMKITAVNGSSGNRDVALNLDIHDAGRGRADGFLFLGDSITARALAHRGTTFSQLVQDLAPSRYPVQEAAAMSGWNAEDALPHIDRWLRQFHGQYVVLAFGANQRTSTPSVEQFEADMRALVEAVVAAEKTPILPQITYSNREDRRSGIAKLNAVIDRLAREDDRVLAGPDLFGVFEENRDLLDADGVHPTRYGESVIRSVWAEYVVETIYPESAASESPASGTLLIPRIVRILNATVAW